MDNAPWVEGLSDELINKLNQNLMSSHAYSFDRPDSQSDVMTVPDGWFSAINFFKQKYHLKTHYILHECLSRSINSNQVKLFSFSGNGNVLVMPHPARENDKVPRLHTG